MIWELLLENRGMMILLNTLRMQSVFLVFLSGNSICSEYVLDEIYYAKKAKINTIPCYIENIELPEEVFHRTTCPFYTGVRNSFFLEHTSVPFPEGSYFDGEDLESFELYWMDQEKCVRKLLWRYQFMGALELEGLTISYVHKFEDPYFDEAITDIVLFNMIIRVSGRYLTPFSCVDIVLTIGIINGDTDAPKLNVINGQAFNQDGTEKEWDISFAERLVKEIMSSIEPKEGSAGI